METIKDRDRERVDYSWTNIAELRSKLAEMLERAHAGFVTDLRVLSEGDTIILAGEVASEVCRGDAKRFALAFNGVLKVRNELVVAAFLEAASDDDLDGYFGERPKSSGGSSEDRATDPARSLGGGTRANAVGENTVEVVRHPVINLTGRLESEEWVDLTIDLPQGPQPGSEPLSFGEFSADWTSIQIAVQLLVPWASETVPEIGSARIMPDGRSEPARFRCRVTADFEKGSPAEVQAVFLHGSRICGHIVRDVATAITTAGSISDGTLSKDRPRPDTTLRVMTEAVGPSVSISIIRTGERSQHWVWRAVVPGGVVEGTAGTELGGAGEDFAENLLKSCPGLKAGRFQRVLDGLGERLWDAAPAKFQGAYADWRAKIGPSFAIQFVTDDPYIPWEMMKPRIDGVRHLFLDHPVARWPLSGASRRRDRFECGDILSFVPKYEPHSALPFAEAEGDWIRTELGGQSMTATIETFLDVLDGKHSGPVAMLHFAGHGQVDAGTGDGGIEMVDGVVSVAEVHQDRVILGHRDGTLVVLNACETSAGARLLGMNWGWGAAIADREFGGLIAPLWEVQDEVAFPMMKQSLPGLLDGALTLGEAVVRARLDQCDTSVAAYAYLAHGDVMARFTPRR